MGAGEEGETAPHYLRYGRTGTRMLGAGPRLLPSEDGRTRVRASAGGAPLLGDRYWATCL